MLLKKKQVLYWSLIIDWLKHFKMEQGWWVLWLKKKNIDVAEKIIFFKIKFFIRIQKESKTYLTSICKRLSIFWEGGTKSVPSETKLHIVSWTKSKMYSLKVQGELLGLFFYYTLEWICPYMFLPQVSSLWHHRTSGYRKLSILRAPVLQWNKHPTQFHLKK